MSRVYKDTSPEAEKRRAYGRKYYREVTLSRKPLKGTRPRLTGMTPEEKVEHQRKNKAAAYSRARARYNRLAKDGIISPSHIQHDEPLSRYLADRMIRQEAGISTRAGFNIIGDGCFRARAYPKHS